MSTLFHQLWFTFLSLISLSLRFLFLNYKPFSTYLSLKNFCISINEFVFHFKSPFPDFWFSSSCWWHPLFPVNHKQLQSHFWSCCFPKPAPSQSPDPGNWSHWSPRSFSHRHNPGSIPPRASLLKVTYQKALSPPTSVSSTPNHSDIMLPRSSFSNPLATLSGSSYFIFKGQNKQILFK